ATDAECMMYAEDSALVRTRPRERPDTTEPSERRRFRHCGRAAALRTRLRGWGRWWRRRLQLGRGGWRRRLRALGPEIRRGGQDERQPQRGGRDRREECRGRRDARPRGTAH